MEKAERCCCIKLLHSCLNLEPHFFVVYSFVDVMHDITVGSTSELRRTVTTVVKA